MEKMSRLLLSLGLIIAGFNMPILAKLKEVRGDSEFTEVLSKNKHVIIKFYADWCSICNAIKKPFKNVARNKELSNIMFVEVDISKPSNFGLAGKYQAQAIPKFVYIKNGQIIHKELGVRNRTAFENDLTNKLKKIFPREKRKKEIKQKSAQKEAKVIPEQKSILDKTKQLFIDMYTETKHLFTSPFKKQR